MSVTQQLDLSGATGRLMPAFYSPVVKWNWKQSKNDSPQESRPPKPRAFIKPKRLQNQCRSPAWLSESQGQSPQAAYKRPQPHRDRSRVWHSEINGLFVLGRSRIVFQAKSLRPMKPTQIVAQAFLASACRTGACSAFETLPARRAKYPCRWRQPPESWR